MSEWKHTEEQLLKIYYEDEVGFDYELIEEGEWETDDGEYYSAKAIIFKDLRDNKFYKFWLYKHNYGGEPEVYDPAFEVAKITKTVEVWESVED